MATNEWLDAPTGPGDWWVCLNGSVTVDLVRITEETINGITHFVERGYSAQSLLRAKYLYAGNIRPDPPEKVTT